MKFNPGQPHGTIVGHEWARYEQNGILYDGAGLIPEAAAAIDKAAAKPAKNAPASKTKTEAKAEPKAPAPQDDLKLKNATEFLTNLLSGGPIDKSVVFKESDSNCQDWGTVKAAFAQMNGVSFKRGQSEIWRLNPEEVQQ